jgi:tRNA U34 2-thiouridine synthase MnmA/TrmU
MYDAVCLTSGGLDSMVCLHLLRERGIEALPVFINYGQRNLTREFGALWPAPGSEDTELGVFMGPEVSHGETKVYAGVQA